MAIKLMPNFMTIFSPVLISMYIVYPLYRKSNYYLMILLHTVVTRLQADQECRDILNNSSKTREVMSD